MTVPDRNLQELREQGFTVVEGFLATDELEAARKALWRHYPRPEEYFADVGSRFRTSTSRTWRSTTVLDDAARWWTQRGGQFSNR